jgi:hypothetical protein
LRLTIPQTKGSQTEAVIVPLTYGQTELCLMRALTAWLAAAGIKDGPLFRRIWLPARGGGGGARPRQAASRGEMLTNGPHPREATEDAPLASLRSHSSG